MLKARLLTALSLIAGSLVVLFLLPLAWAALMFALVAGLAAREWAAFLKLDKSAAAILAIFVLLGCGALWWFGIDRFSGVLWGGVLVFWGILAPVWLWRAWSLKASPALGTLLGMGVIVATWAALVALHARSPWLLLAVMAVVWVADSAAYFFGRAFGRHKLAPTISPGKTWEGVAGGVLGVLVYGFSIAGQFGELREIPLPVLAAILLVLAGLSVVGDLFESLAKRQVQLKDSGNLLPGHGGVLDRIDSLMPTLPMAALLLGLWGGK